MKALTTAALLAGLAACQKAAPPPPTQSGPAPGSAEWKIQNAMSAAPQAVSAKAQVVEVGPDGKMAELRPGSNGWTCMPDNPATPGNDPMCGDQNFMAWASAWMGHTKPAIKSVAFAYMLQGGSDASNTDPFKTQPDPGQSWVNTGPHVMIMLPDPAGLAAFPTDYQSGEPFIMFQKTPYAHVMMPVK